MQQNVPEATVTGGGWSVCHQSTFDESGTPLATIQADCDKELTMMACRPVGDPNFTLVAAAPRADVFFDTGMGNVLHDANGVGWYYNDSWSWGFVPQGDGVIRNSCDVEFGSQSALRMCVHTGGGVTNSGYRCGSTTLNGNGTWERVILEADATVNLTVPGSNSPRLIAEELIIPPNRTVTNNGNLDIATTIEYAFSPGEVRYARLHCPGVQFAPGTTVTFGGDPSNLIGAVNTTADGAIYFSITAGATPVVATDTLTFDGDRVLTGKAPVNCTYGLYDVPSQAQAGGATGRVTTTSGAYIRFAPSYALAVDNQGNPVANVESEDPAYSEFVFGAPTFDILLGQIGGFSYGTVAQVNGTAQPMTLDGNAIELTDLMGANTALVFSGDFDTASDVFFSADADCGTVVQSADSFDDSEAVFVIGNNAAMNHFLCFEAGGDPIRASEYTVSLAPVSASAPTYAVGGRGPLDLGMITRNGTELQAPLAQVPANYLSRMVLTNTGSADRPYEIAVFGEAGNVISTANLTGTVPAGGT
ncbi:MAG TPA: hypothetical protein VN408_04085, partial [Actinoplanes sp.]|nr:hypothetical protein [Actinoplanes sp.]